MQKERPWNENFLENPEDTAKCQEGYKPKLCIEQSRATQKFIDIMLK